MNWTSHLCKARFELLEGDGDERERLVHAAEQFRAALAARANWPPAVRLRADALRSRLFAGGGVSEAITRMDESTLRETSDALWQFCEVAEPCPWDAEALGVRGIEHLREARTALHHHEGDLRERLRTAAQRFRAAVFHAESWPESLRATAEALTAKIFGHGKAEEPVRRMGDKTAGEISQEILRLCDDAERHDGGEGHSRRDHPC